MIYWLIEVCKELIRKHRKPPPPSKNTTVILVERLCKQCECKRCKEKFKI